MILDEPRDAIVSAAAFFAGRECHDERALGHHVLALEPKQRLGERRRAILDVARAAAVEESVALGELVRVDRPVGAERLDDIEMRDQEDRLERGGRPLHAHDDVRILVAVGTEHVYVGGGKACVEKALRDGVCGGRRASFLVRRLGLDELLKDRASLGLIWGERGLCTRGRGEEGESEREEERVARH